MISYADVIMELVNCGYWVACYDKERYIKFKIDNTEYMVEFDSIDLFKSASDNVKCIFDKFDM